MAVDANWIDYWAGRYRVDADEKVLNQVGPRVRQRKCYDREDFMAVGEWKSPGPGRRWRPILTR
ncbi:hypothetical protein MNAB215_5580 [Mycobacterium numidiamassiliense]|uniref:Uncharacterized protein n=1 Tax=Mycobacterium numidiamassiliense TaxID=1841861 RepID=A0A2U3PHW3_9MYCO|nr:hypothetical protein MNAB215_5580 [Mycobacterium numidiamassiliense]